MGVSPSNNRRVGRNDTGRHHRFAVAAALLVGHELRAAHPSHDPVPAASFALLGMTGVRDVVFDDAASASTAANLAAFLDEAPFNVASLRLGTLWLSRDGMAALVAALRRCPCHHQMRALDFNTGEDVSEDDAALFADAASGLTCVRRLRMAGPGSRCVVQAAHSTLRCASAMVLDDDDSALLASCARLRTLGDDAFAESAALTEPMLPPSLRAVGSGVFYECPALTAVDLRATAVASIGDGFATRCGRLALLRLPATLRRVGGSFAFGLSSLTVLDLAATQLAAIGHGFARDCTALVDVRLPPSVTTVGAGALVGCASLVALNMHETSVRSIGPGFANCCGVLPHVAFPATLETLGGGALHDCAGLKCIDLSRAVLLGRAARTESLGQSCPLLHDIRMPPPQE
jgi:hypothetical protein